MFFSNSRIHEVKSALNYALPKYLVIDDDDDDDDDEDDDDDVMFKKIMSKIVVKINKIVNVLLLCHNNFL